MKLKEMKITIQASYKFQTVAQELTFDVAEGERINSESIKALRNRLFQELHQNLQETYDKEFKRILNIGITPSNENVPNKQEYAYKPPLNESKEQYTPKSPSAGQIKLAKQYNIPSTNDGEKWNSKTLGIAINEAIAQKKW